MNCPFQKNRCWFIIKNPKLHGIAKERYCQDAAKYYTVRKNNSIQRITMWLCIEHA